MFPFFGPFSGVINCNKVNSVNASGLSGTQADVSIHEETKIDDGKVGHLHSCFQAILMS